MRRSLVTEFKDHASTRMIEYRTAYVKPGTVSNGRMANIALSDGNTLSADQYVFACGPWLKTMFPEVLGPHLRISRQEMFYFGTPADDNRFDAGAMPAWTDIGDEVWYGVPGGEQRGFKIADDALGPPHDPSTTQRMVSENGVKAAREYTSHVSKRANANVFSTGFSPSTCAATISPNAQRDHTVQHGQPGVFSSDPGLRSCR